MNQTEKALRDSLMGETGPGSFKTNWMVEAGAGAGKTHIIAWRIVRQLISGHCQPDQLVAITFTNKATNELQDRVTQYLRKERDNCSQAAKRERLTALYRAAGAMQISTIHGFCQSMLQEMPVQAGLNLESTLLDEEETSAYYREVYRRIQQEHVDCFAPLERYGIPAKLLDDLFQAAVRSPEQSIPYDWEDSKEYKDTQKALIDAGEALRQKLHGEFDHCQPQLYGDWLRQALSVPPIQTVDAALSLSRQLDLLLRPQDFVQKIRSGRIKEDGKPDRKEYPLNGLVCEDTTLHTVWSYYLDLLKQCRELEKKLEKERQKKRQTDTVKATIQQLEQEVHDLQNKLAEEKKHPAWEMVNAELNILLYIGEENKLAQAAAPLYYTVLMETLTQCLEWAREDKDRKNLLTYDDLLLRTRNLLRDCPEARRRFHQRYPVIYVDEFQDTDPIQAQILFYLTTSEQAFSVDWTKCRPEAGSLFLVGDPKQSIYRFRGADLSIYQTVRSIFQRENAVNPAAFAIAELHTNFRSTQPICNQITQLFQDKLDGRDGQAAFLAMEATEEKKPWAACMPGERLMLKRVPSRLQRLSNRRCGIRRHSLVISLC